MTELLKMEALKANNNNRSLTQGDRGSSGDTKNHGETFQPEPTAERRDSAPESGARENLDSPEGRNLRQGLAVPSGAVAGAISKSFQEVSGRLSPAPPGALLPRGAPPSPPAALPAGPCGRALPGPAPLLCGCGAPGSAGWS